MAKIKKQTIRRSNSNVKASSGKGLKKSFNLRSRKVQFFVVIVIVALLGGGWFTYKSFAASSIATVSNGILSGWGTYSTPEEASKNKAKVIRLKKAGSTAQIKFDRKGRPYLRIPGNVKVRYCYMAKADAPTGAFLVGWSAASVDGGKGGGGIPAPNTIIGTSYSSYCTPYEYNQNRTYAYIALTATTNTPINVSMLYAEY